METVLSNIDNLKTDEELIALRKLLYEKDKEAAVKLASTSMDPEVLSDLAPVIGPSYEEVFIIADRRLKELFPEKHRHLQIMRDIISHPRVVLHTN